MGNRAVLEFKGQGIGIYLHWNGGRASVEAFLRAAKDLKIRSDDYGAARLCQVIGNWFGGGLSLGISSLENLDCDNGDNGVYVIEDWKIVDRSHRQITEENDTDKTVSIYRGVMDINAPIFDDSVLDTTLVVERMANSPPSAEEEDDECTA